MILVLGDIHFPAHHPGALGWALSLIRKHKPEGVVQIGDLYDQLAYTRYYKPESSPRASSEMGQARDGAAKMWAEIRKHSKRRWQIRGNHDMRAIRRIREKMPEAEALIDLDKWYRFEGVETLDDDRSHIDISGIRFLHGYRSRLGDHARFNECSTVVGHSHLGGVVYQRTKRGIRWELNCGWLGNDRHPAFDYMPQKVNGWTLGVGVIDALGPRFIPYPGKA